MKRFAKPEDIKVGVIGRGGAFNMGRAHLNEMRRAAIVPRAVAEIKGWKLYQNVADHLVKGTPLVITPEWARRRIHILDLACQSAKKGKSLKARYK